MKITCLGGDAWEKDKPHQPGLILNHVKKGQDVFGIIKLNILIIKKKKAALKRTS